MAPLQRKKSQRSMYVLDISKKPISLCLPAYHMSSEPDSICSSTLKPELTKLSILLYVPADPHYDWSKNNIDKLGNFGNNGVNESGFNPTDRE